MTGPEKIHLAKTLTAMSAYYGEKFSDDAIAMMVEDLGDLPFMRVMEALKEARRDSGNTRFPRPAVVRERCSPGETPEDQARLATGRLLEAISRFGWNNPERAREFVGELGWEVVKQSGGWEQLCSLVDARNVATLRAQWRDQAITLYRAAKAGKLNTAPALPTPGSKEALPFNPTKLLGEMPK